ncbi:MAG: GatB/YqeY domain-containing protein [Magnetococcus sp. YQC-3]
MNTLQKIKNDLLEARKDRDNIKSNLLNILLSDAIKVGKDKGNRDSTEQEVIDTINKFIKNNKYTLLALKNNDRLEDINRIQQEMHILSRYLPKPLTEEELTGIIKQYINDNSKVKIGGILSFLKEKFPNRFDNQLAAQIVKKELLFDGS